MMERNYSFDFLKGCLIILVVWGHALQCYYGNGCWYNPIFNIIYTFHMPLFMFVSGYFFQSCLRRSFSELFINRCKRLVLPAIIYTSIILCLFLIINKFYINTLWDIYMILKTYWYLICLFILTIMYYVFFKSSQIVKILLVLSYILSIIFYEKLPVYIIKDCQVIRMTLIFGLGIVYRYNKENIDKFLKTKLYFSLTLIVLGIIEIIAVRYSYGINLMNYPIWMRISDGIICSMFAFILIKGCYNLINRHLQYISIHINKVGTKSLGIYVIHIVFFKIIAYLKIDISQYNNVLSIGLLFFVTYLLSYYISVNIKNTQLKHCLLGE